MFLAGTALSFASYTLSEKHNTESGILLTVDFLNVAVIVTALLICGKRKDVRFKPFEKRYLGGAALIALYGIVFRDAIGSNFLAQALITIGYFPTFQSLVTEKRNSESFSMWGGTFLLCFVGLCSAIHGDNRLATIYASRGLVLVGAMLCTMTYYHRKQMRREQ